MNKLIDKILKEAEDFSDDFFQSKHVNKRSEEFNKKSQEILLKLKSGLNKIKADYDNQNWKDEEERLFLKLFSNLHIDNNIYIKRTAGRYYLLDRKNNNVGHYSLKNNTFYVSHYNIYSKFYIIFNMNKITFISFIANMLEKYFSLCNLSVYA